MMEVEACPNCRGMWLDAHELDKLEDVVFDEDDRKGSLLHKQTPGESKCPHCAEPMTEFQYRLYNLHLDYCAQGHGFWLDAGEDERVMESMRRQAQSIQRKMDAEAEWKKVLKNMHAFIRHKRK